MFRDPGPRTNLGFGIPLQQGDVDRGGGGETNPIEKALYGHPVMRFFAVAAASTIGMGLAGKVARNSGLRITEKIQDYAKAGKQGSEFFQQGIKSFRRIESHLDDLQGLARQYVDEDDQDILVRRINGKLMRDTTTQIDSFHIRASNLDRDPSLSRWSSREAVQQKLVAQARRLPYEAPAFYVAQKALIEPITGQDNNPKNKVNWSNPLDVIGDFGYQTVKNLAFNVAPFEIGGAAVKNTYRNTMLNMANNPNGNMGFLSLRVLLEQVGADMSDLVDRTAKFSHQTTGAFSSLIDEAANSGMSFNEWVRTRKNATLVNAPKYKNANFGSRLFQQARDITRNKNGDISNVIDMLPPPFKGMGSGISRAKKVWHQTGDTYDDWQAILAGKPLNAFKREASADRYERLVAFMRKGGGTSLEQFGTSVFHLGAGGPQLPGGVKNDKWTSSTFYQQRSGDIYKGMLGKELARTTGLPEEEAMKFVSQAKRVSQYGGARSGFAPGEKAAERFQYLIGDYHGSQGDQGWWNQVVQAAGAHKIGLDPKRHTYEMFQQAMKVADVKYSSRNFQKYMQSGIASEWKMLHDDVLPRYASKTLSSVKRPYELFTGKQLETNADFLVRRSAQRLGINIVDGTGNPIPLADIERAVSKRGLNPGNLHTLRGFLVDKKDIDTPWNAARQNVFGFRTLSIQDAFNKQFFAGHERGVQDEIRNIITNKTNVANPNGAMPAIGQSVHDGIWNLRLNKVYQMPNGKVLDLNRATRGFMSALDKVASDYQVPLLHLKPLQVAGWNSFQSNRNMPSVVIASGQSMQPFAQAAGKDFEKPNFYAWIKTNPRHAKGHVVGVTGDAMGGYKSNKYDGLFRPNTTNPLNMLGRYGNILMGHEDVPGSQNQGKWKKLFHVSYNQENNLFNGKDSVIARWYRTIKGKPDASRSPRKAAKQIAQGIKPTEFTSELSEGFSNLTTQLRSHGLPKHVLRELSDDPRLAGVFQVKDSLGENILDTPDELLPTMVKRLMSDDIDAISGSTDSVKRLGKFQQQLKNLVNQGEKQIKYWDLPAPQSIKTTGISRRIDQLKGELYDYLAVRTSVMPDSPDFSSTVHMLLGKLDEMFAVGKISGAEKSEARAAVLSLQIENARNITYNTKTTNFQFTQNQDTISYLMKNGVQAKELLDEVGSFAGLGGGVKGRAKKLAANAFDTAPYQKPMQINPSGSDIYFMPNFKSVYNRNKRKAISGTLNNWSDPEGVSGLSIPMTHLAMRLNSTFEMFGLGLDPTKYKGPLSFYTKGIVGRRVLPAYVAGTTALAVDRTIGGAVNDKDQDGNRVYSPFFLGLGANAVAAGQVGMAGLIPGGQTASEKRKELLEGEVPIRNGRFWALGNTPFKGGRIKYFRPSWYNRFKSGSANIPELNETPMEKLLFGYDFSPLRPLDPYRRERQDYKTRPYPLTGEYFNGPWGPLTGALNATVGRILKPQKRMHTQEMAYGLNQYLPVGESGSYFSPTPTPIGDVTNAQISSINAGYIGSGVGTSSIQPFSSANNYAMGRGRASDIVRGDMMAANSRYEAAAQYPAGMNTTRYMPVTPPGSMSPRVLASGQPVDYNSPTMSARRVGYLSQEITGIYGFASASIRERLGIGKGDLAPSVGVLESASRGYSASRSFWGLNLGGLGDLPLPIDGQFGNLEFSEIMRRFVPKEQGGIDFINPIPNQLGQQYPWLPGSDYPIMNLKTGDPYNKGTDMEIRLPGSGYMRTHDLYSDQYGGKLGLANIHDILGDVAPWSKEYKAIDSAVKSASLDPRAQNKIRQTRAQVEAMRYVNEFTPYEHRYDDIVDSVTKPTSSALTRGWEWLSHRDTFVNTKLGAPRTAVEDWERDNVYGATFPKWSTPYQSFLKPAANKYTQRDPFTAAAAGGALGYLFGVSHQAKTVGSVIGGLVGASASLYGNAYEKLTGDRFIPLQRRKELALEESIDILSYTKAQYLKTLAARTGDAETAAYFAKQASTTMYGANLNSTPEQIAMAVPKRKREHFRAMLFAPEQEREQILSTAGRLERRLYQAAWGMDVEQLPDLKQYYQEHELPPPDSEFWSPFVNMDSVKIKMGQSMGLDMSQMGFYPQQLQEANLLNPVYPNFDNRNSFSIKAQLKRLMMDKGILGTISTAPSPDGTNRVQLNAGVY